MDASIKLYDSLVCRLCAEENRNGSQIYQFEEGDDNLGDIINKYLPLKVKDDGKLPCTLCPGCTIQLDATRLFFDLIVDGQKKLRELADVEQQQEKLRREDLGKEQLESALKIVNPNSSVQTYSVQSDESGEKIFIQILSDGPLFPADHEMSIKLDNGDKPKKKRGRPPKPPGSEAASKATPTAAEEIKREPTPEPEEEILDANGKPKRRIKKPMKYSDLLQGKELDRVFLEEGLNDEEESPLETSLKLDKSFDLNLLPPAQEVQEPKKTDDFLDMGNEKTYLKPKSKKNDVKKKFECEICGRTFLHQSRLEMHKLFHKDIFYQCTTCTESFSSKEQFEEHTKSTEHTHFKLIEYVENYGQIELPNSIEKDLNAIKTSEPPTSPSGKYVCDFCEKSFSTKQNLEVHQKAIHENEKPYTCDKCDKQFPYLCTYKNHLLQHSEKTYPCEQCDKIFHHPSSLVYHRETEHNNGRKFVCNKCKKCFKHRQLLLRHQLVHTSERPFNCTQCTASFKTRSNLVNHVATHSKDKKFFCQECGLYFGYKTSLNLHQRWHNGQKPYECDVCFKTFSQKGNLAEHRRIHTGEKPFCCSYCGRRFTTSSQYKLHVKRHTGERPWRCEYCPKSFLHKDTWKCHTRRHRNERPYQCSFCLRGFTELWALKKHERLHTGEKPYTCDVCGKHFADSSNLKKHTRIHNKNHPQTSKKPTVELPEPHEPEPTLDDNGQVLYLTYQDENAGDQQALVHIVDGLENEPIPTSDNPNNDAAIFGDDLLQGTSAEEISIDVQQLVDNDGNAISFTTDDGQQIKVVTTMDDEQCIQGLLPDGTLIPINLSTQDGKPVAELIPTTQVDNTSLCEPDLNALELLQGDSIDNDKSKIHFINEDGRNLCFITTYDNQFINMN